MNEISVCRQLRNISTTRDHLSFAVDNCHLRAREGHIEVVKMGSQMKGKEIRNQHIVGIEKNHKIPVRRSEPRFHRFQLPTVFCLEDGLETVRMVFDEQLYDGGTVIGRRIVNHDTPPVVVVLGQH